MLPLLEPLIQEGRLVRTMPDIHRLRKQVLADLDRVPL
jgi:hypothetical protein